jgi:hypothetical protein
MRKWAKYLTTAVFATALLFSGSESLSAQVKRKPVIRKKTTTVKRPAAAKLFRVPAGKRIRVRMDDTISSKTAKVGDRFTAVVREPVYASTGTVVIPEGSEIIGRVDAVVPARKGGKPGTLDMSFVQVVLPNGSKRAINGSLTELVSDDAKSDSEGTASGDKMKHRKVIFIGGGGAGGAILGAAIGGGKGALVGALLGAGGGFLGEKLTKGEEAEVRSGTEFGVHLNRAISLPRFAEVETRQ